MSPATPDAPAENVTTRPFGAASEFVLLDGRMVGSIIDNLASPGDRGRLYRFVDRDAAIAACVSYAQRGYWTGEL